MVESAREVCGSVRVGGGNPKSVWWNNRVKAVVKMQEKGVWKSTKKRKGAFRKVRSVILKKMWE